MEFGLASCHSLLRTDAESWAFRSTRKDHHLDDIVAVLGDGERTLSQADLLSVEDWATVHLPPHQNDTMILLSDEDILGNGAADHLVVLYANLGSPVFATVYQRLCIVEWCGLSYGIVASSNRCNSPLFYKGMEYDLIFATENTKCLIIDRTMQQERERQVDWSTPQV